MTVAYTSDLHLDFYVKNAQERKLEIFLRTLLKDTPKADVIIIAGDISHYNSQSVAFLKLLNKTFKHVLVVGGNHECYNVSKNMNKKYTTPYARLEELVTLLADEKDIHYLDGSTIIIDGIKFGGAMGWYDGAYYYKYAQGMYGESIMSYWCNYTNDANLIPCLYNFMDMYDSEIIKVDEVLGEKPDVMVTHFCPTIQEEAIAPKYQGSRATGFYCFEGTERMKGIKYWVHGHMHDRLDTTINGTRLLRNPIGYPKENAYPMIHTFSI